MDYQALLNILRALPQLMQALNVVFSLFLIWIFGGFCVAGIKTRLNFGVKVILRLALGTFSLLVANSLSEFFVFFEGGVFDMLKINLLTNCVVSSALIFTSLFLITTASESKKNRETLGTLREKVDYLEDILLKKNAELLSLEDVKRRIGRMFSGYEVENAEAKGKEWILNMRKGKIRVVVKVDGFCGDVKEVIYSSLPARLAANKRLLPGAIILSLVLLFLATHFKGLPSTEIIKFEDIESMMGIPSGTLSSMIGENLPEGCVSLLELVGEYNKIKNPEFVEDASIKNMVEKQGDIKVGEMVKMNYKGDYYIVAFSEDFSRVCFSRKDKLCGCVEIPEEALKQAVETMNQ